jgi:hypothetical protein
MIKKFLSTAILLIVISSQVVMAEVTKSETSTNAWYSHIEQLVGLKGTFNQEQNLFKVTSPRTDVKVNVDQIAMPPFMGLTSWASFTEGSKGKFMVMGDIVLFPDEVNPVMSVALDKGLDVTALHNHFFFDDPKVFFMHIGGEGSIEQLTIGVRKMLDKIKEIRSANTNPVNTFGSGSIAQPSTITGKVIEDILGVKGQSKDGMFKATIGRETKMACGCKVGKDMGINTWAAFMGSDDKAIVDGDFVVHEDELQTVLKSLRHSNINVVAIHSHMTQENPRMLFLHYWGIGSTKDLSKALKTALNKQNKK